ncbi:MAG: chloride channel protein [Gemmatimonadetes bacterium]|nr:MAG: chloride channel protein [Gemmatimonadota bacterium]
MMNRRFAWIDDFRHAVLFWFLRLRQRQGFSTIYGLAVLVGLGAGIGSVLFYKAIMTFTHFFFGTVAGWLVGIDHFYERFLHANGHGLLLIGYMPSPRLVLLVLIPMIGAVAVSAFIRRFAPEAEGHGVPEVMEAVAKKDGVIPPHVAIVKILASALCISTGGSVGREGPSVQIGAAIGSSIGQFFRMSADRVRVLVGCGAAAGIAASFNAPIAGALFASEIILTDFAVATFSPLIISSVTAVAVARTFLGDETAFHVPTYEFTHFMELPLYALLGIIAGVISIYFIHTLYRVEDSLGELKIHPLMRAALGGTFVGVMGLYFPQLFGIGYELITNALAGKMTVLILFFLIFIKPLATGSTLGGGGSGGVFAPTLFMGAVLGDFFGQSAHSLFPALQSSPGAFALVGMAALVSGVIRAPLTGILIIFEITGSYEIILPVMLAAVTSALVAHRLEPDTIYTIKLKRRGIHIGQEGDVAVLQQIRVSEVMDIELEPIKVGTPAHQAIDLIKQSKHDLFPVVTDDHSLIGTISFQELRPVLAEPEVLLNILIVDDFVNRDFLTVNPESTLLEALHAFSVRDVSALPVVDRQNPQRLVGILRRPDVLQRYRREVLFSRSADSFSAETPEVS